MSDINAVIDGQVKGNDVFLYMKGTPDFPMCGFSGRVVQILDYLGIEYGSANVLENQELREGTVELRPPGLAVEVMSLFPSQD